MYGTIDTPTSELNERFKRLMYIRDLENRLFELMRQEQITGIHNGKISVLMVEYSRIHL